jgi:hypothetical protein
MGQIQTHALQQSSGPIRSPHRRRRARPIVFAVCKLNDELELGRAQWRQTDRTFPYRNVRMSDPSAPLVRRA